MLKTSGLGFCCIPLLALSFAMPSCSSPSNSPNSSTKGITGKVYWYNTPVVAAGVKITAGTNYYMATTVAQTATDKAGAFKMLNVPAGDYYIFAIAPAESTDYWEWVGRSITVTAFGLQDVGTMYLSKKMTLLTPTNGAQVTTTRPTFSWNAFPNADHYILDCFVNSAPFTRVLHQTLSETEFTPTTPFTAGLQYQWSVYAETESNLQIAYSSAWIFDIQ